MHGTKAFLVMTAKPCAELLRATCLLCVFLMDIAVSF